MSVVGFAPGPGIPWRWGLWYVAVAFLYGRLVMDENESFGIEEAVIVGALTWGARRIT